MIVNKNNNVSNFAWSHLYFGDLAAFVAISSHVFSAHAHKRLFRQFRWKNLTSAFDFLIPISLQMAKFRQFEGTFSWFFYRTRNTFCGTWYLPHSRVHVQVHDWIVRIVKEYRILYSFDVVIYMYCLKILSEYWKVTRLFKPLPRYRNL